MRKGKPDFQKTFCGKLTSLSPYIKNIALQASTDLKIHPQHGFFINGSASGDSHWDCQISQENGDFFILKRSDKHIIYIEDSRMEENEARILHSGDKISIVLEDQPDAVEYIFSLELNCNQKVNFKESRKELSDLNEKFGVFQEDLETELNCLICRKTIYECASVAPCLHSFCLGCLMKHMQNSQECPQCGEHFVNFRKNTSLNYILEAYQECGYRKDRSQEEVRELERELERGEVFARFEYADGVIYEGNWSKCRRNGQGKMRCTDGEIYEGDWKHNKREGKGKAIYASGSIYEGDWKGNKREGRGKMIYANNGDIYEGDWKDNKREGKGKMIYTNGGIYEGDWKGNKREGRGKTILPPRYVYEGEWKNNKIEGKGKMIYTTNGWIYEGDWKDNKREGKGKMIYANNGDIYEGDWKDNKREGKGKMIYTNGCIYEGEWKNNKIEGKGKMIHTNGCIYEGDWKDDAIEGKGKMIFPSEYVYEGDWKENKGEDKGK